jgi:tetratricopeptide (TPR) repeat protein
MNYFCPNLDCAIHQKGKAIPSMGECPLCDTPLISNITYSDEEELVLNAYPYVIAYPFERMLQEEDGRNKLELLAYTFLNGLKFWGLVLASEYFQSPLKSAKINELFKSNLYQPSFGNWNAFIRETIVAMEGEGITLVYTEFIEAYKEIETGKRVKKYRSESPYTNEDGQTAWKKSELSAISTLINFRNRYLGHGIPLSKKEYSNIFKEIYPVLIDFLKSISFTTQLHLVRQDGNFKYLLKGYKVQQIESSSFQSGDDGFIVLSDFKNRQLNLLPFYILPKQFIAGADNRAEVMVYEQNTGSRVVFFSPESIKAEESGQVLERIQLFIQEKERTAPCRSDEFTLEYVRHWVNEHNEKTIAGLKREKKLLDGIYQNRIDAESALVSWFQSCTSLFVVSAEAGSGKTNLMAHMHAEYQRLDLTSLFIRAARCKSENWEEILREMLNAPIALDLKAFIRDNYSAQVPLMILIDGGNEHPSPLTFLESICQFIVELPAGSIKVVLSWRSSTVMEMPEVQESMEPIVYAAAERKEGNLLSTRALRLTGLDKVELEGAWKKYVNDKNLRSRPVFDFSDLMISDSALVEELSNPLLLRLFLELFHGKPLPKTSKGFINLWAVWWNKIDENKDEAKYLRYLASVLMEKQQLQIPLDALFEHPVLGDMVKNIQIDSPHQQLLRKGIISQYFSDNVLQVSFTMEAAFYFVASLSIDNSNLFSIPLGSNLWKEALKFFIWKSAATVNNEAFFEWVDNEYFPAELFVKGLAETLVLNGAPVTLNKLLASPSMRDFEILENAFQLLTEIRPGEKELRASELLKELLILDNSLSRTLIIELLADAAKPIADDAYCRLSEKFDNWNAQENMGLAIYLGRFGQHRNSELLLNAANDLSQDLPLKIKERILEQRIVTAKELGKYKESLRIIEDLENVIKNAGKWTAVKEAKINSLRGKAYEHLAKYNKASICYTMALEYFETHTGEYSEKSIETLLDLGDVCNHLSNHDKALSYFEQAKYRYLKVFNDGHKHFASVYSRIGSIFLSKGNYDRALEYYEKTLDVNCAYFGVNHPESATAFLLIGDIWEAKGQYDMSLEYFERALNTYLNFYGESHPKVANALSRIGSVWITKGQHDKSLEYFQKDLKISIDYYGESHPNVASTLTLLGDVWNAKCQYSKSLEYFEKALRTYLDYYGESHPRVASTLTRIGGSWKANGQYDKALEYFQKSLKIYIDYFGESHTNVASTYFLIGDVWNTKGQFDKALEYFEKDLKISIDYYGESHPNVASTLTLLGDVWNSKGQYDKALDYFEKALNMYIAYYGESHPNVASSLNRIGGICNIRGQYDKSLEYFEKDLKISIDYYGESHPNVASTLALIGDIWDAKGQYEKSLECFEKTLNIYLNYYRESHPNVASTLTRIGGFWSTKGEYDKSLEHFEKALNTYIDIYGESHPNVAFTYFSIGDIWNTKGQYDKALEYYEKDLKISIDYYGESHPNVAATLARIGGIWSTKGQLGKSLEYFEKALNISIYYHGDSHPNVASALTRIGDVLEVKGQYDKALEYFQNALNIRLEYYGETHPYVASNLNRIGSIFNIRGQYENALEYFERDLKISIDYFGESHPNVATSYYFIGGVWNTKGKYDKALEYFEKSLKIRIDSFGESHTNVALSQNYLGLVYCKCKDFEKALKFFNSAYEIYKDFHGEESSGTASVKRNIAHALIGLEQYEKAQELLGQSEATLRHLEENTSPVLARALVRYAELLRLTNKLELALKYIDETISIFILNPGEQNVETASAYFEKASVLDGLQDSNGALIHFQKCYDIRLNLLGSEHLDTIDVLKILNNKK